MLDPKNIKYADYLAGQKLSNVIVKLQKDHKTQKTSTLKPDIEFDSLTKDKTDKVLCLTFKGNGHTSKLLFNTDTYAIHGSNGGLLVSDQLTGQAVYMKIADFEKFVKFLVKKANDLIIRANESAKQAHINVNGEVITKEDLEKLAI